MLSEIQFKFNCIALFQSTITVLYASDSRDGSGGHSTTFDGSERMNPYNFSISFSFYLVPAASESFTNPVSQTCD